MIQIQEDPEKRLVEIDVSGKVTRADIQDMARKLGPIMENRNTIRVLEVVHDFEGIEPRAILDDLKFDLQHIGSMGKIEKCAVVADSKWMRVLINLFDPLYKMDLKGFKKEELEQAREWVLH